MRDVGDEQSSAQLVSTGPDHLGFGYGSHACPGRFLAANEVKVILCHMLLKYEWKFVEICRPDVKISGTVLQSDPHAKISIRRRQEEILLWSRVGRNGSILGQKFEARHKFTISLKIILDSYSQVRPFSYTRRWVFTIRNCCINQGPGNTLGVIWASKIYTPAYGRILTIAERSRPLMKFSIQKFRSWADLAIRGSTHGLLDTNITSQATVI